MMKEEFAFGSNSLIVAFGHVNETIEAYFQNNKKLSTQPHHKDGNRPPQLGLMDEVLPKIEVEVARDDISFGNFLTDNLFVVDLVDRRLSIGGAIQK